MNLPFIDLSRLVREVRDEVLPAWTECLDKTEFVGGPRVAKLEHALCGVLGTPRVVTCANGTDALVIALYAQGVRAGMKVALPNLTFWATYEAVVQLGATPVLVDIDPDDLQMSFTSFTEAHDKHRFNAALLVHLYGWTSARLSDFRAFCKEREIALVEDGAQCFGVSVDGKPILAQAPMATLSFYPAKVVGGAMDGGAITVQTEAEEKLVRSLCNHGRSDHYSYAHAGWNSRMGGVQAAFLLAIVAKTEKILSSRRQAAETYRSALKDVRGVRVYGPTKGVVENGYLNVMTVEGKRGADLGEALKAKGIGHARTYPETIDEQPPARGVAIASGDLKHSKAMCARVINLPLFYGITREECDRAIAAFREIVT